MWACNQDDRGATERGADTLSEVRAENEEGGEAMNISEYSDTEMNFVSELFWHNPRDSLSRFRRNR